MIFNFQSERASNVLGVTMVCGFYFTSVPNNSIPEGVLLSLKSYPVSGSTLRVVDNLAKSFYDFLKNAITEKLPNNCIKTRFRPNGLSLFFLVIFYYKKFSKNFLLIRHYLQRLQILNYLIHENKSVSFCYTPRILHWSSHRSISSGHRDTLIKIQYCFHV